MIFAVKVFHEMLGREYPSLMGWFWRVYEERMFKDVVGELELLDVPYPRLPEQEQEAEAGKKGEVAGIKAAA